MGCRRPAVEFEGFSFTYEGGSVPALRGIDLCLEAGGFHLVVGASGSGKTSLVRSIVGLIPHFYRGRMEGSVSVLGTQVARSSIREVARRVGYVFQDPENQLLASTAGRDVAMSLESLGYPPEEAERIARDALRQLGSEHLYDRPVHQLSDGEKQRVAIAGEIARSPEVLVLDEPSSMLDPESTRRLMELLAGLRAERGLTLVLVEHRLEPALPFADTLVLLSSGRVELAGPPRDLLGDWASLARMKSAGVAPPAAVQVYHRLRLLGVNLGGVPLSVGELRSMLAGPSER
ncbi:MAG: energy-coupling factor ABC transporter ATP-binding protein [Conexivisphaera sp.]